MDGTHRNGWIWYFYSRCINADADRDGFNDSWEYGTLLQTAYNDLPKGTNYLRAKGSDIANDQTDFYPVDFNDDNFVNQLDVDRLSSYLGQGNGLSLDQISPNPNETEYSYKQMFAWRRFDLNGDGYVNSGDLEIVKKLVNGSIPPATDIIAPTTRITRPTPDEVVVTGVSTIVGAHAWDNQAIAKVEFYVNNQQVCSTSKANSTARNQFEPHNPLYSCYWNVPKQGGSYSLYSKVYDNSGNSSQSETRSIEVLRR